MVHHKSDCYLVPGVEDMTTAQAQSKDAGIARAKTIRAIALVLAIVAVATLVYGFGMKWPAYYQVAAGFAAFFCVEWQRKCTQRIKVMSGGADPSDHRS
jgi:hypothetical protein